ncbi:MAG: cytidylate kinase, partial [Treponema sp.]|nr:cytidylate kinase [Treponema sp.]
KPLTRAQRILKREGGDLEKVAAFTEKRDKQDRERYIRIYQIDNDDYRFADLIIDTDDLEPPDIADLIIKQARQKLQGS